MLSCWAFICLYIVIFTALPLSMGFMLILTAFSVPQVYAGRFLTGACGGMTALVVPVYIAEVASAKYRGVFVVFHQVGTQSGITVVYAMGIALTWRWLAVFGQIVPLVFVCTMVFMPETPRWLYQKNYEEAAVMKLQWLRGKNANIDVEIKEIERGIELQKEALSIRDFKDPWLLKTLMMVVGLMMFNQLTGTHVITYNMEDIFTAAGSTMDHQVQSVIVASVGIIGTFPAVILIDNLGRKLLMIVSFGMLSLALGGLGAYFMVLKNDPTFAHDKIYWLPLACLIVYKFCICFGAAPVPFVVMSEVFPLKARGVASSLSSSTCWITAFIVSKTHHSMIDAMGAYGMYWFYAAWCLLAVFYVIVFVPETKKKTLEQLEGQRKTNAVVQSDK